MKAGLLLTTLAVARTAGLEPTTPKLGWAEGAVGPFVGSNTAEEAPIEA